MTRLTFNHSDNLSVRHYERMAYIPCCSRYIDRPNIINDSDKRPFCNISNGIEGSQKNAIWNAVNYIYTNCTYKVIKDAFVKIDFVKLAKHPKLKNETPNSLMALRESFSVTERIERTGHLTRDTVGIKFIFVSNYKTFSGDSIRLEVPTIVTYSSTDISWQVLQPSFHIGGGANK